MNRNKEYDEAIQLLLEEIEKDIPSTGVRTRMHPLYHTYVLAIEAMKKQVGVKPKRELNGKVVRDLWICPICKSTYEIKYNYCPNCGDRIAWEREVYEK